MNLDDSATALEELERDIALKMRKPELPRTGFCYWCGEETTGVYCSPECQADHAQSQRFRL